MWQYTRYVLVHLCYLFVPLEVEEQVFNPSPLSQREKVTLSVVLPNGFTPRSVQEAFSRAQEIINSRNSTIYSKRRLQDPMKNIPSAWHQRYSASNSQSRTWEDMQEPFEEATRVLQAEFNLTTEQILFGLAETGLASMLTGDEVQNCIEEFDFLCALSRHSRTHRGFCNNLRHPSWGMASSCFEQLVEPDYADGDEVQNCTEEFDFLCALSRHSRTHRGFCNNLHHPSWGMASSCFERLVEPDYADGDEVQNCTEEFDFLCALSRHSRTHRGFCNNLRHPSWGMASSCFERLVEPDYADGDEVQICTEEFDFLCALSRHSRTHRGFCNNLRHPSWGMASSCFERLVEPDYADGDEVQICTEEFDFLCALSRHSRTHRGFCNNLRHPSWGMASSCFERLVEPDYADGISEKRVAASGKPLPSPRLISLELHSHFDNPTDNVTHMFMVWGQFLGHDISLSPQSRVNNESIECCPVSDEDSPQCDPILVARDDPFYSSFGINCLNNVRSIKCLACSLGPRQQMNQVTSYIDASHIYSLDKIQYFDLRNFPDYNGTFRFVIHPQGGELPPGSYAPSEDLCSFQHPSLDCFETGDHRANQHPALTSLHVLFLREHNRIVRKLKEINCWWTGSKISLHTKKIVGAIMQHITYNEFLPLVLGPERMEWFDLSVRRNGFTQYDETVKATLVNEFSTAAYRFGHSMINSFFPEVNKDFVSGSRLRDMFQYPFGIYKGQLDGICAGLINSSAQKSDRRMVRDVTNHLFQPRWKESGLDLAALNINRGRDHGIPGYTTLVEFCGGPKITSWNQLDRLFQKGLRPRFQRIYEDVRDIDLFSGGLAERPLQGAAVGPTFACIIGIQFYHLKYGDRFFFEHGEQGGSFSEGKLREIKKMTLAKLMCQNSGLEEIQPNVMQFPSDKNAPVRCEDLPEMDLNLWLQPLGKVNCSDENTY